ncbi:MAG: HNH endonuclease [Proteobacteria bacterium]|nr:HNH endonuclease [Pseudomonadota bacterium]
MNRSNWNRQQLLVAFYLYCQIPFGKLHSRNPEIIKYASLVGRTSSALAMKLTNIASLDPAITSTGRKGLKGASLADRMMWEEMQNDWENFVAESQQAIKAVAGANEPVMVVEDKTNLNENEPVDYTGSNKTIQTKARVGQNFFRKAVLSSYNWRCCITGLAVPRLLVASHIIPWSEDAENRLNPRNGLSLSILHDKAFDIGLITINEDMTVRVSRKELVDDDAFYIATLLSYEDKPISLPEKFFPHADFLAYHRKYIFKN